MQLSRKELATVLAALRRWQRDLDRNPNLPGEYVHFDDVQALSVREIDALCERMNLDDEPGGAPSTNARKYTPNDVTTPDLTDILGRTISGELNALPLHAVAELVAAAWNRLMETRVAETRSREKELRELLVGKAFMLRNVADLLALGDWKNANQRVHAFANAIDAALGATGKAGAQ